MLLFMHMAMLTPEDLKLIGEELGSVIEQNITPQFDEMRARLDKVDNRLDGVESRLDRVENRLEGVENKLDRVDGKVTTLTNVLLEKRVITFDDKTKALS